MSMITKLSYSLVLVCSALVFTCCATLPSNYYQIFQVPQPTGTDKIDNAIVTSMQRLGYRVEQAPGNTNMFIGSMKVPDDIWKRDYKLTVLKSSETNGSRSLITEAETCRGCIVTADDSLSPANRVKAFKGTFCRLLAQYTENESVKPPDTEPAQNFYNEFFGNKPSESTQHQTTEPPDTTEKSIEETIIATESSKEDDKEETRPRVVADIETLTIEPSEVPANTTFDVTFTFKVIDTSDDGKELSVQTYYEVYLYEKKIFTSDIMDIEIPNGELIRRRESVKAGSKLGEYSLQVVVEYKDFKANMSTQFKIISTDH